MKKIAKLGALVAVVLATAGLIARKLGARGPDTATSMEPGVDEGKE
jgi:hypothetical protein